MIDAVDDISPLVRAAHLEHAIVAAAKLKEIVSLEQHVIEFKEGQRLLALKPQLSESKVSILLMVKWRPYSRRKSM